MNILILTKENNGGGLVTHVINLANTLKKKGHNVIVVGPLVDGEKKRFKEIECQFEPMNLSTKNPLEFLKNTKKLIKITKKRKIDIIHSHNRIASIYAQILWKKEKIPFVWTLHLNNIPSNPLSRILTFYGKKVIVVSSDIIPFCRDKLKINPADIAVGYNGVPEDKYRVYTDTEKEEIRNRYKINKDEKVIVVLSRLDPIKGHEKVIEAVSKIKTQSNYVILFTGESMVRGYKEALKKLIVEKGVKDKIKFVGHVNPVDILNISDIFLLPSDNEGFPISMIEAFLLHVPVIRTKTGGYEDVKKFIIPMEGIDSLTEILRKFLSDQMETKENVENGYQFAIENCTCKAMTERVLGIYEEVIGGK